MSVPKQMAGMRANVMRSLLRRLIVTRDDGGNGGGVAGCTLVTLAAEPATGEQ
jgi:hypothetical protein